MTIKMRLAKEADVKLSFLEKCAFGCGNFGFNIIMGMTLTFLPYFWTSVIAIPATITSTALFIIMLWDAVNDPLIGAIADRRVMAGGTYRKWLWYFIPTLFICLACFTTLRGASMWAQIAFCFTAYFLYTLCDTFFQVPHVALMSTMTTNYKERASLAAYRQIFGGIAAFLVASVFMVVVFAIGGNDMNKDFSYAAAMFIVIAVPFFLINIFFVKERVVAPKQDEPERIPLKDTLMCLKGNWPAISIVLAQFCWGVSILQMSGSTYLWRYVYGDLSYQALSMTFMGSGVVVAGFVNSLLVKKTKNKRNISMVAWGLAVVAMVCNFFVPLTTHVMLFHVFSFLYSLFGQVGFIALLSMIPDVTEYTQKTYGLRTSGLIYACSNFAFKFASAITTSIFIAVLAGLGYLADQPQPEAILTTIKAANTIVPAIVMAIGIYFIYLYKLTEESHQATLDELQGRA